MQILHAPVHEMMTKLNGEDSRRRVVQKSKKHIQSVVPKNIILKQSANRGIGIQLVENVRLTLSANLYIAFLKNGFQKP